MKNMTLKEFTELTASKTPVPGGGSISALCGSLAAALAEMVANLTVGNKKYLQHETKMKEIIQKASVIREELLEDIERDSDAFAAVMDAYRMPKDTDDSKVIRRNAIQTALKKAVMVPMDAAKKSLAIMDLSEAVVKNGNKNAVTDGLVSCMLARTAVLGALLNAKINLASVKDSEFVRQMNQKITILENSAADSEKRILESAEL